MDDYKGYILSIIVTSVISSIFVNITKRMGTIGKIIKLLCGVLLVITLIRPITNLSGVKIPEYFSELEFDAENVIDQYQQLTADETQHIIKEQTEAYILDRATQMGLILEVDVNLSDASPYTPVSVVISGDASPYFKQQLQKVISNNLGIQEENQVWQ